MINTKNGAIRPGYPFNHLAGSQPRLSHEMIQLPPQIVVGDKRHGRIRADPERDTMLDRLPQTFAGNSL
ncbi:hypothetical protein D3C75_1087550 [compost metagenome]